jgi:hypothetical protein
MSQIVQTATMAANTRTNTIPASPGISIAPKEHGACDKAYYPCGQQGCHVDRAIPILGKQDRSIRDQTGRREVVK